MASNLFDVLGELQDAAAEPWLCATTDWRIASVNRPFEDLVGMKRRKLVGVKPPYVFWDGAERDQLAKSTRPRALSFTDAAGERVRVSARIIPVRAKAAGKPDAYVLRAIASGATRGSDDAAVRDRLRRLETTLARIRHELDAATPVPRPVSPGNEVAVEALQQLSVRERQVVDALLSGQRVAQVSESLGIAPNTVRNHIKAVFRKIGVRSQTELFVKLRFLLDNPQG